MTVGAGLVYPLFDRQPGLEAQIVIQYHTIDVLRLQNFKQLIAGSCMEYREF